MSPVHALDFDIADKVREGQTSDVWIIRGDNK